MYPFLVYNFGYLVSKEISSLKGFFLWIWFAILTSFNVTFLHIKCSLQINILILLIDRASDNWKNLKELEKAVKVYWKAKNRLPPRVWCFPFALKLSFSYIYTCLKRKIMMLLLIN